jgi:hypothetical protein
VRDEGYLVKYNASGYVQWSILFNSNANGRTKLFRVATDGENIYVFGHFGPDITLNLYNAGDNNSIVSTLTNTGDYDSFIAKYNSSGHLQWRARVGDYAQYSGLSIDNNGNIYVAFAHNYTTTAFYNKDDSQAATLNGSGNLDAYIAKYNSSGYYQWSLGLSGSDSERVYSLATTNDGAVYVTGSYRSSTMIFYNKNGGQDGTLTNSGNEDAFIAKYNSSGFLQWCTRIDGTSLDRGEDISVDITSNVYIVGSTSSNVLTFYNKDDTVANTTIFKGYDRRGYIAKYDSNGYFLWRQVVSSEYPFYEVHGVAAGNDDNVYFTGTHIRNVVEFYNNGILAGRLERKNNSPHMFVARYSGVGKSTIINSKKTYDNIALNASGGNVGIGTNAPMCALDVNGDINFSGRISGPGFTIRKFHGGPIKEPTHYGGSNEISSGIYIEESVGTVYYSVKSQTNTSRSYGSFDYAILDNYPPLQIVDWSTKAVAHRAHTNTNMHIIAKMTALGDEARIYFADSGGTTSPDDYEWEIVIVKYKPFTP